MFYSVNNTIHISRGETPTYRVRILDTDGAPYRLYRNGDQGMKDVVVSFTVRESLWETGNNYEIKYNILLNTTESIENVNNIKMFSNTELGDYNKLWADHGGSGTISWDNSFAQYADANRLYRMIDDNQEYSYKYVENGVWVDYDFVIQFIFRNEDTAKLMNKKYKYDLVLLSGELNKAKYLQGNELFWENNQIDFKKQLLSPSDFIVEASINE